MNIYSYYKYLKFYQNKYKDNNLIIFIHDYKTCKTYYSNKIIHSLKINFKNNIINNIEKLKKISLILNLNSIKKFCKQEKTRYYYISFEYKKRMKYILKLLNSNYVIIFINNNNSDDNNLIKIFTPFDFFKLTFDDFYKGKNISTLKI